jgi:hypothetical protein
VRPKAKKVALAGAALVLCAALATSYAQAERAQKGKVQIKVGGGIVPTRLPRSRPAPVGVLMSAAITTTDRSTPPELKEIVMEINRHGALQTKGLASCSLTTLETSSAAQAKQACAGALLGHGNVSTHIALPSQGAFASQGELLAFNGRLHGRPAILAQVTASHPLALDFVIRFEIKKSKGTFGTKLVGTVPPIASGYGEITAINLSLKRTYRHHGKQMSVLSAACPAPAGFPGASFPFARTSFAFADGTSIAIAMTRNCKVRGK